MTTAPMQYITAQLPGAEMQELLTAGDSRTWNDKYVWTRTPEARI